MRRLKSVSEKPFIEFAAILFRKPTTCRCLFLNLILAFVYGTGSLRWPLVLLKLQVLHDPFFHCLPDELVMLIPERWSCLRISLPFY